MRKYISLLLCVLLIGLVLGCDKTKEAGNKGDKGELSEMDKKNPDIEERLTDWVFEKSSRISRKTANIVVKEAMKTDKPLFILALQEHESQGFIPTALSRIVLSGKEYPGAMGLGQVRWEVWGESLKKAGIAKEKRDLWDIDVNTKATNFVLDVCLQDSDGDIVKALSCYLTGQPGGPSYYKNLINDNLASLYVKVHVTIKKKDKKPEVKPEVKKSEIKKPEIKKSEQKPEVKSEVKKPDVPEVIEEKK